MRFSQDDTERGFLIEGPLVSRLFASQVGTCADRRDGTLRLLRIGWRSLAADESADAVWRERQLQLVGQLENSIAPFGPLVGADVGASVIDARTGLSVRSDQLSDLFRLSILASLPLPQEIATIA